MEERQVEEDSESVEAMIQASLKDAEQGEDWLDDARGLLEEFGWLFDSDQPPPSPEHTAEMVRLIDQLEVRLEGIPLKGHKLQEQIQVTREALKGW